MWRCALIIGFGQYHARSPDLSCRTSLFPLAFKICPPTKLVLELRLAGNLSQEHFVASWEQTGFD